MIIPTISGYEEFANADATVEFINIFNDLFDVFNTKSIGNENKFKNSLCSENAADIFEFFERAEIYIRNLKMISMTNKRIFLCKSKLNTAFTGFIIDMTSLRMIYKQFVEDQNLMTSLSTFPLLQDRVEILFSKIRSANGYNDNPTVHIPNCICRRREIVSNRKHFQIQILIF